MVNFDDPNVQASIARVSTLVVHAWFGIYFWEWASSLWFDLKIVRREIAFNSATFLYLAVRYSTLVNFSLGIVALNMFDPHFNCQNLVLSMHALGFGGVALASGLLYLRVCAITNHSKPAIFALGLVHLAQWAMVIYIIVITQSTHIVELGICAPIHLRKHRPATLVNLSFDVLCVGTMIAALMKMRHGGALWTLLVRQGLLYMLAMTVSYIIVALQLHDSIAHFPEWFSLLVATIGVTRMHRNLNHVLQEPTSNLTTNGHALPRTSLHFKPRSQETTHAVELTVWSQHQHSDESRTMRGSHSLALDAKPLTLE